MASSALQQPAAGLLGRERECAVIDRLLADARGGVGGAVVVRGEAGIGKSAMLAFAVRQAMPGMLVLRADGVEAESDLAFAGLHGLLRPVLAHLGELPETQSAALAGALGLAPSALSDRLLISAAVLSLLAVAAEDRPALCVVDDAQWMDRPSADALVFTARRLQAERLAMLFGAREGEVRRFEAAGIMELPLAGLSPPSAAAVLAGRARNAAPAVRERLLAEAEGNPLALLELPAGLSQAQLEGRAALPEAIPLSPRLEGVFRQRAGRLSAAGQAALLVASADTTGDVSAVLRALAELGLPPDALDSAEGAGLIRIADQRIIFRHPLVRSALHQGATLSQRQRAHGALAVAFTGDEHADRRVWHQAMATVTGDEEIAAALEASARRAQLRAGHASAAAAFLRAAELSTDEARRTQRIAAAAGEALHAGQADRARGAIVRSLPLATGKLRAQLLQVSGVLEARTGSLREAWARLAEAAEATSDASLKIEMLLEAAEAASLAGDFPEAIELTQRIAAVSPVTVRDRLINTIARGYLKLASGEHEQAQSVLAGALKQASELEDPRALVWSSYAASVAGDERGSLRCASRAVAVARQQGLLSLLPLALQRQSMELFAASSFDLAYAAAEEGYRLSIDLDHGQGWHLVNMAAVESVWGREQAARRHAGEALTLGQRSGWAYTANTARGVLAFIELSMGRLEKAADALLALTDPGHPDFNPVIGLPALTDAVEAAIRAGRRDEAAGRLAMAEDWITSAPTQARRALLARCQALLGERDPDEGYGEAIDCAPGLSALERARTELLYGEWLRRERRRTEARAHLHAALELFQRLGAVPWAERTEAELRATGEAARKRDAAATARLTPQEVQVAGLVAGGLTNREIAAQLFLSPRTIDYHLRKVFTKLGIGSRTELVRHVLAQRTSA
jgi:DNA-binding CsgD family transcriptional regulator